MGLQLAAGVLGKVGNALAAKPDAKAEAQAAARKTAEDFETMFLENSLNRLAQSGGEDGPLGANGTDGIHRSMLVDQYAKQISKAGGVGIADQVYRHILQMQEGAARG
jgi:Rod binding domain-containing protein